MPCLNRADPARQNIPHSRCLLIKKEHFIYLLYHSPGEARGIEHKVEVAVIAGLYHVVIMKPLADPLFVHLPYFFDLKPFAGPGFEPIRGDMILQFWIRKPSHNIEYINWRIFFLAHKLLR